MKKTYIIPKADVISVQTQQMLAGSLGYGDDVENTDRACSRKNNFDWEEDEDF